VKHKYCSNKSYSSRGTLKNADLAQLQCFIQLTH